MRIHADPDPQPCPHLTSLSSPPSALLPQLSSLISHPFSLISHLFLPHPCSLTELIRIHKAPENGSNMDPDPQHCNATTRFSEISKTSPTSTLQYRSTYVTHWQLGRNGSRSTTNRRLELPLQGVLALLPLGPPETCAEHQAGKTGHPGQHLLQIGNLKHAKYEKYQQLRLNQVSRSRIVSGRAWSAEAQQRYNQVSGRSAKVWRSWHWSREVRCGQVQSVKVRHGRSGSGALLAEVECGQSRSEEVSQGQAQ